MAYNQRKQTKGKQNHDIFYFFQNELSVEIFSKGLVRAIGKVLLMNFS